MNAKKQRAFQAYRRSAQWCVANPTVVPAPAGSPDSWAPLTRQLVRVEDLITQIIDAAAGQEIHYTATKLVATDETALRKHLRDELRVVVQVGQALRKQVPGIGILKMPEPHVSSEALCKSADALTQQAATYESVLLEHGVAHDFVAQLQHATAALRSSIDSRGAARISRKGSTEKLEVCFRLAKQYVEIMDASISKALRGDSVKLTEWKTAKRIVQVGSSAKQAGEPSILAMSEPAVPAGVGGTSGSTTAAKAV